MRAPGGSRRSAPAQKEGPRPASTATRVAKRVASPAKQSSISSSARAFSAFLRSGRASHTHVTGPRSSISSVWYGFTRPPPRCGR